MGTTVSARFWQLIALGLAWVGYSTTYLLRKPISVIKNDLKTELGFSMTQLGWLDTAFLLPYAASQVLLGSLGDRVSPRKMLGGSMLIASASMVSFGYWKSHSVFLLLLFINGAAQSLAWPGAVKGVVSWFNGDDKNTALGVLGTSAFVGGFLGTAVAVQLQKDGWETCFVIPSVVVASVGLVIIVLFKSSQDIQNAADGVQSREKEVTSHTSFSELWRIRSLPEVTVCCFFVKFIRYCMLMWLPMYLYTELRYSKIESGMLSTVFDIGGILGSVLLGFISDRLFQGNVLCCTSVALFLSSAAFLLFLFTSSQGMMYNGLGMLLAGITNCGSDTMITGPIAAQIGEQDGRNVQSATTGIVNGIGTAGAILQGPLVGILAGFIGWSGVFYAMVLLTLVSGFFMVRVQSAQNAVTFQEL